MYVSRPILFEFKRKVIALLWASITLHVKETVNFDIHEIYIGHNKDAPRYSFNPMA